MKHIHPPNPLSILPEQSLDLLNKISDYNEYDLCISTPLFEDYKHGKTCILSWKEMQKVRMCLFVFKKTIEKFEH